MKLIISILVFMFISTAVTLATEVDGLAELDDFGTQIEAAREAANNGNAESQAFLADTYLFGPEQDRNIEEGLKWLRLSIKQDNDYARLVLSKAKKEGIYVELPEDKAARLANLEQAKKDALAGSGDELYELAYSLTLDPSDENYDFKEAIRLFEIAANRGDTRASGRLGVIYQNGEGVERNMVTAMKWFKKAVEDGDAKMAVSLGDNYYNGEMNFLKNYTEAAHWYRIAAVQGNAEGQFKLGFMYWNGRLRNDGRFGLNTRDAHTYAYMWIIIAKSNGYVHAETEYQIENEVIKYNSYRVGSMLDLIQSLAARCMNSNYKNCSIR